MRTIPYVFLVALAVFFLAACSSSLTQYQYPVDECYLVYKDKRVEPVGPFSCEDFEKQIQEIRSMPSTQEEEEKTEDPSPAPR